MIKLLLSTLIVLMFLIKSTNEQCPSDFYQSFDNLKCYYFGLTPKNFFDSIFDCNQHALASGYQSGTLVSIHSAFENENIRCK
jgi:hypothetical protein